jgi:hypothetical protein
MNPYKFNINAKSVSKVGDILKGGKISFQQGLTVD